MPTLRITTTRGWIADRSALLSRLRHAAMAALGAPASAFSLALCECEPDALLAPEGRGPAYTSVDVLLFPGRSRDTQAALFQALAGVFSEFGLSRDDLDVFLAEVDPETSFIAGRRFAR